MYLAGWRGWAAGDLVYDLQGVMEAPSEPFDEEDEAGGIESGYVFGARAVEVAAGEVQTGALGGSEGPRGGGLLGHVDP